MVEFLLTFVFLLLIVAGMSIGVLAGRKPISGSCGGLNSLGVGGVCEICGGDPDKCESSQDETTQTGNADRSLYYDASK